MKKKYKPMNDRIMSRNINSVEFVLKNLGYQKPPTDNFFMKITGYSLLVFDVKRILLKCIFRGISGESLVWDLIIKDKANDSDMSDEALSAIEEFKNIYRLCYELEANQDELVDERSFAHTLMHFEIYRVKNSVTPMDGALFFYDMISEKNRRFDALL